jgi:hypothetical protein
VKGRGPGIKGRRYWEGEGCGDRIWRRGPLREGDHKEFVHYSISFIEGVELMHAIKLASHNLLAPTTILYICSPFLSSAHSGFSGVLLNFFPWLNVWLYEHRQDSSQKRNKVQQFASLADRVIAHKVEMIKFGVWIFVLCGSNLGGFIYTCYGLEAAKHFDLLL